MTTRRLRKLMMSYPQIFSGRHDVNTLISLHRAKGDTNLDIWNYYNVEATIAYYEAFSRLLSATLEEDGEPCEELESIGEPVDWSF